MLKKLQRIIMVSLLSLSMVLTGLSYAYADESLLEDEILTLQDEAVTDQIITDNLEEPETLNIPDHDVTDIQSDEDVVIESGDDGIYADIDKEEVTKEISVEESENGVTTEKVYEQGNIKYVFTITNSWSGGYNARVEIYNNGSEIIDNWAIDMVFQGEITNIWNATIENRDNQTYTIKNATWNADIGSGCSVSFGFTGKGEFYDFPRSFNMLGIIVEKNEDDYDVQYYLDSDWGSGFTGRIVITNNSEETIEDWILSFTFDREITSIWNASIESHEGNRYVVKNMSYNANILPGKCISFGFSGRQGASNNTPCSFILNSVSIFRDNEEQTNPYEATIEAVNFDPNRVVADKNTACKITVCITGDYECKIKLYKKTSDGWDYIVDLYDDGQLNQNGDEIANDGLYTNSIFINEGEPKILQYKAVILYDGIEIDSSEVSVEIMDSISVDENEYNLNLSNHIMEMIQVYMEKNEYDYNHSVNSIFELIYDYCDKSNVDICIENGSTIKLIFENSQEIYIQLSDKSDMNTMIRGGGVNNIDNNSETIEIATTEARSILYWAPFDSAWGDYDETECIKDIVNDSVYCEDFEIKSDSNANVESLKDIYRYGLIILATHGIGGKWIVTGEEVTDVKRRTERGAFGELISVILPIRLCRCGRDDSIRAA